MMATTATIIAAVLIGAAWRRWFGSARPSWAFTGYRALQVVAGISTLALICLLNGDLKFESAIKAGVAIGFMTLPIQYSRQPFVWLARQLNLPTTESLPHPWKPMLQGAEPWGEAIQGACVWSAAITL